MAIEPRILATLGWTPHVGLDDGLRETVDYFRKELSS